MKGYHNRILIFLLLLCPIVLLSQKDSENLIMYERGFEFKKGVYLSFEEFKNNSPSIVGETERAGQTLYVYDDSLKRKVPIKKRVWGYSNGRNVYIQTNVLYVRIGLIGALSHIGILTDGGSGTQVGISSGGVGVGVGNSSQQTTEYMLDFSNGEFIIFQRKNFEIILESRDPLLFEKYKNHKGKKKEKLYLYLNAYNDKHPIYFPE